MTISEAARVGITRIRMPGWGIPTDYVELSIADGRLGPWMKYYREINEKLGHRNPLILSSRGDSSGDWVEYIPPAG